MSRDKKEENEACSSEASTGKMLLQVTEGTNGERRGQSYRRGGGGLRGSEKARE